MEDHRQKEDWEGERVSEKEGIGKGCGGGYVPVTPISPELFATLTYVSLLRRGIYSSPGVEVNSEYCVQISQWKGEEIRKQQTELPRPTYLELIRDCDAKPVNSEAGCLNCVITEPN
ncbi:hypothetical protein MRX96_052034 [Rhipicephalus microplus]